MNKVVIVVIVVVVVVVAALMVFKGGKSTPNTTFVPPAATAAGGAVAGPAANTPAAAGAPVGVKYPDDALQDWLDNMPPSGWKNLPAGAEQQLEEYAKTHQKTPAAAHAAK